MTRFLLYAAILFSLTACSSPYVFEQYKEIPEENWSRYNVVEFTAAIPDSGYYHINLAIRHTTDFEMANLWCFISTRSHAAKQLKDTVNVKIAEPDGRWLGEGHNIRNVEQAINKNPMFLPKGNVIFRIEQGMRLDEMKGVKSVGINITRQQPATQN